MLGKAFGALGDVGKQIWVPQAQKLVRQVDDLTGGDRRHWQRSVKGLSDAKKAAGEAIDTLKRPRAQNRHDFGEPKAPAALRKRAQSIRAEAELRQAAAIRRARGRCAQGACALETRPTTGKEARRAGREGKAAQSEQTDSASDDDLTRASATRWTRCRSVERRRGRGGGGRGLSLTSRSIWTT